MSREEMPDEADLPDFVREEIRERRADEEFMGRRRDRVEADAEILRRLAEEEP